MKKRAITHYDLVKTFADAFVEEREEKEKALERERIYYKKPKANSDSGYAT